MMKALTISTAWIEILVPLMAIVGGRYPIFRLLAVITMVGLHAIFGSALKIGLFPYISSLSWIFMIPGWLWDKLEARIDRTRDVMTFVVTGLASERWARLLKTGLLLRRVRIALEPGTEPAFSLVGESGPLTGTDALRAVLRASPLTRWVSLWLPFSPWSPASCTTARPTAGPPGACLALGSPTSALVSIQPYRSSCSACRPTCSSGMSGPCRTRPR